MAVDTEGKQEFAEAVQLDTRADHHSLGTLGAGAGGLLSSAAATPWESRLEGLIAPQFFRLRPVASGHTDQQET